VPVVCTVIGEGGSGGALAIAVGDVVMMLQYATYSVISPEGCASILWKSSEKASVAADILGITATRLKSLSLVDKIINEPLVGRTATMPGGAESQEGCRMRCGNLPTRVGRACRGTLRAPDEPWQVQGTRAQVALLTGGRGAAVRVHPGSHLVVGLSGGVDSVTLLAILADLAGVMRYSLRAVHVHHGISPNASIWAQFCQDLCRSLKVPLQVERVQLEGYRSLGVEALRAGRDTRSTRARRPTSSFSHIIGMIRPRRCCCSSCAVRAAWHGGDAGLRALAGSVP